MMAASQRARRTHASKQNHPRRNKREAGTAATLRSRRVGALDHAVRVVHGVCCLAGSASLIDDLRAELRAEGVPAAIRRHDTATLFDWLIAALSYQGISDRVASGYMERHGRARWADIDAKFGHGTSCPKLQSYWHYHGCRYDKISRTCTEPDHIDHCPVPSHDLRNGRLNQTAYSLYFFVRDIADGDLVGWIDRQLREADSLHNADRPARLREALIGPLREVHGVSDKVLTMTLSCILLTAPRSYEIWREVGATMTWLGSAPTISMARRATGQVAALTLLPWWPSELTPGALIRPSRPFSRGLCSTPSGGTALSSASTCATATGSMIGSLATMSIARFATSVIV